MKFANLDSQMCVFETAHDHCVLSGIYIVPDFDSGRQTKVANAIDTACRKM